MKNSTKKEKRSFWDWMLGCLLGFENIYTRSVRYRYRVAFVGTKIQQAYIERDGIPFCVYHYPNEFTSLGSHTITSQSKNIMLNDLHGLQKSKVLEATLSHDIAEESPNIFMKMRREIYMFSCELKRP